LNRTYAETFIRREMWGPIRKGVGVIQLVYGRVVHSLDQFKKDAAVIVANRFDPELEDAMEKVYTRDLYFRD